jgi:hypothetical protein
MSRSDRDFYEKNRSAIYRIPVFIFRSGEFIQKLLTLPGPAPTATIARVSNNVPDRRVCDPSLPKQSFLSFDLPVPHPALSSASGNCPLLYSQRHGDRPDWRKSGQYDDFRKTVYKNRGFLYIIPEKWSPERQSGALKSPDSYVGMQASRLGYNPTFYSNNLRQAGLTLSGGPGEESGISPICSSPHPKPHPSRFRPL